MALPFITAVYCFLVLVFYVFSSNAHQPDGEVSGRVPRQVMGNVFGIPVPGNSIEALDVLKAYLELCQNDSQDREQSQFVYKLLSNPNAKKLVDRMYRNLFASIGEVDAARLTGKWYHVMDTKPPDREKCGVVYVSETYSSKYLASYAIKEYFRPDGRHGEVVSAETTIEKVGTDLSGVLYFNNKAGEKCPYFVIKTGPVSANGQYEYVVFAPFLKHPLIAWARDPLTFHANYTRDVERFLDESNMRHFLAQAGETVAFYDHLLCPVSFYEFINL